MKQRPVTTRACRRGTVMMEMVLVAPFLLLVFVLLIFMGRVSARVQDAQVMARYETWRIDVPTDSAEEGFIQSEQTLNELFGNGDDAVGIIQTNEGIETRTFPGEALEDFVDNAMGGSEDVGDLAEALIYPPSGGVFRVPHSRSLAFEVTHDPLVSLSFELSEPITRNRSRIDNAWALTESLTAMADEWEGATYWDMYPRAVRDVFYEELDTRLDAIDGEGPVEYAEHGGTYQTPNAQVLAGFIRSLYLTRPTYRGPIVFQERPE